MNVFVVTSQELTHDSSYYEVITVCSTLEKAQAVLGTYEAGFINWLELNKSLGIEDPDFHLADINIEAGIFELTITDQKTGMFCKYIIDEIELE